MIDIDWGNAEETILIWTFYDGWKEQDFLDAIKFSEKLVARKTSSATIHTMIDVQHTGDLPANMFSLGKTAIQRGIESKNDGLIIIINPSELWLRLYEVMSKMIPNNWLRVHFAKDANEAYAMMNNTDAQSSRAG